ncbi:MAG: DUF3014 domain-containing protein [Gammaproteobacteria bacterium]|nr:DUF3014 domain-containing protein [Gammaproteobacteria bacterium]
MPLYRDNSEKTSLWVPVLVVLALIAGIYIWQKGEKTTEPAQVEQPVVSEKKQTLPQEAEKPVIRFPVPEAPVQVEEETKITPEPVERPKPLPALDESDASIQDELSGLYNQQQFGEMFLLEAIVRHFVVTVDNMTGPKLPQRYAFTKPPAGKFAVKTDTNNSEFIDPENYKRYAGFIKLAETVDTGKLVSVYVHYYPLFQKAYEELGYPNRYFNDRLIEVIDHLLMTPVVQGPIKLVRPKVYYQFANPELEALSAGQKILIRIGHDNAVKVKAKLREIRKALTTLRR